ncbi:hypothetical protein EJF36_05825 [Bacillus sp. HMF5848]|uniref:S8 family peptidase n=1 Tax=Bacillus sp. HMF5848 TaxID=2495421 RepID=UPI000F7909F4|nr:S8 family peptidase [Bacillus sp. HMF5848]RSK26415.1 hypothetical protein EJF36_05825 [Bacillus sp. HMF5848]
MRSLLVMLLTISVVIYPGSAFSAEEELINIAILDTGISQHDDLTIQEGVSFLEVEPTYNDKNGHGTHIAGIIHTIAPNTALYPVKVLDKDKKGKVSFLIKGIEWAIENEMDIVSISLTTSQNSEKLQDAIQKAAAAGIVLVAAVGNHGDTVKYPAAYEEVVAVGAVDDKNKIASWSNTGKQLDVVAPGVTIKSTYLNNGYAKMSGTSMAAAYTTGVLALLKEKNPDSTSEELKDLLIENSLDLGAAGFDNVYGFGLVQMP